jgi:type IV pilus assembly protein PilA
LLVPFVNLVWQFFVVIGLADSLGNEYRARGVPNVEPEPGKSIGIAMCVCAACGIIPLVNVIALPAYLVLWIIYWAKIAGFSRILDQVPATDVATPYVPQDLPSGMPLPPPGTGQTAPPPPSPPTGTPRPVPVFVWVLVGLVGLIPIMLILMLIAIPTISSVNRRAIKLSAINSIRAIQTAESMYAQNYPANGYACTLAALGGDPALGAPTTASAQFLKSDLASGTKSGYVFTIDNCSKVTLNGTDRITSYTVMAVPETVGKTGNPGYCSDESGVIKQDPSGGTNCTQTVGQ